MTITKKLFSGSALQTLNLLIDIIIGFMMMPFLINSLGDKWYGLWLLIGSILTFFTVLTLGLSSAAQRFLSLENEPDLTQKYNETFNSSLVVFTVSAFAAIIISILLAFIPSLFVTDEELVKNFSYLIVIMGLNIAITFFSSPFRAALTADYRFTITSIAELVSIVLKAILTVSFIKLDYGVVAVGVATLLSNILGKSILLIATFKCIKKISLAFSFVNKDKLRELFSYSGKTLLAWFGDVLRFSVDNIVISSVIGLASVTLFNIPLRLFNYASQFIVTAMGVLNPYFAQQFGKQDLSETRRKFELASNVSFGMAAVLASGLIVFGYDFIQLWIGNFEGDRILTYILPIMLLLATSQNPCILILYAHNKHEHYAYQNILEGIINLGISLVAIHYLGLLGVALGTIIPMLLTKLYMQPKLVCKLIEYPISGYYRLMISCFAFVAVFSYIGLQVKTPIDSWTSLVTQSIVFVIIFALGYWFTVLSGSTKKFFLSKIAPHKAKP